MPRVYQEEPLTMRFCLDCHRKAADLGVANSYRASADPLLGDTALASALDARGENHAVTPLTTCTACHR